MVIPLTLGERNVHGGSPMMSKMKSAEAGALPKSPERPPEAGPGFDEKAWRKQYMRKYMKEWRKKRKALKQAGRK